MATGRLHLSYDLQKRGAYSINVSVGRNSVGGLGPL